LIGGEISYLRHPKAVNFTFSTLTHGRGTCMCLSMSMPYHEKRKDRRRNISLETMCFGLLDYMNETSKDAKIKSSDKLHGV
jgi:hypothetical protein